MTLSTTASRINYPGTGSTGPFAFPFKIQDDDDLKLIKRSSTGVETTLVRTTHYTVSGVSTASGTVTLVTALAVGEELAIIRAPSFLQGTSLKNGGPYFASDVEAGLDYVTMLVQYLEDKFKRSFRVTESYDGSSMGLEVAPGPGGYVLGWDSDGETLVSVPAQGFSFLSTGLLTASVKDTAFAGGAKGDAVTDDTAAFNAAITTVNGAGGGIVSVPAGTYMIDTDYVGGKSIRMLSGITLYMHKGATLRAKPTANAAGAVVYAANVSDIEIEGGIIQGERATHGADPLDFGHGIMLRGCVRPTVHRVYIKDCQGDGIYVGATSSLSGFECTDVQVHNVTSDNNRRQGMSIVACIRGRVTGSSFINTNGNPPSAGIDLEPNAGTAVVRDVEIVGNNFDNNAIGLSIAGASKDITAMANSYRNNTQDVLVGAGVVNAKVLGGTINHTDATSGCVYLACRGAQIKNITIAGTMIYGIQDGSALGDNDICGNKLTNSGVANSTGILVAAGSDRDDVCDNRPITGFKHAIDFAAAGLTIARNDCRSNTGSGIHGGGDNALIEKNTCESNTLAGIQLTSGSHCDISRNNCRLNGAEGISVTTTHDSTVSGNHAHSNSQTTDLAKDNIVVTGDRNLVTGNQPRIGALANRARYGISIGAGSTFAQVYDNDTITGGVTREINDQGTDTTVRNKPAVVTLAYGVTMTPNPHSGQKQMITVTNGVAMTIAAPTDNASAVNFKGMRLTFEILNSSGGAMGAITWNAVYKLAGAFTNPANTLRRTITFVSNGTNWVEESRAAADI